MQECISVQLIARRKTPEGCGAVGLVRRELKIKQKPLISSNKTPPGTRREDRGEGKTAEQGQRRTKPKTGLGGERRTKCTKVERRQEQGEREREREWAPHHRREKGSKRASPIKGSCSCNCSTYSQQILIYGRAIKLVLNLPAAPPCIVITFMGPLKSP